MKKTPVTFSIAQGFILLIALIWLTFAIIVTAGLHPSYSGANPMRWIFALLAFLTCLVLIGFVIFLRQRSRSAYYLTLAFLTFIAILTIADEIGFIDLVTLVVTISPIVLLLINRGWYFQHNQQIQ